MRCRAGRTVARCRPDSWCSMVRRTVCTESGSRSTVDCPRHHTYRWDTVTHMSTCCHHSTETDPHCKTRIGLHWVQSMSRSCCRKQGKCCSPPQDTRRRDRCQCKLFRPDSTSRYMPCSDQYPMQCKSRMQRCSSGTAWYRRPHSIPAGTTRSTARSADIAQQYSWCIACPSPRKRRKGRYT